MIDVITGYFRNWFSKKLAYASSVISIIISVIISLPLLIYAKFEPIFKDSSFCYHDWPSSLHVKTYFTSSFILQFLLPFILVMYVYGSIYNKFRLSTSINVTNQAIQRKRRRTNIILFCITVIFFVSWCPINLLTLTVTFFEINMVRFSWFSTWFLNS